MGIKGFQKGHPQMNTGRTHFKKGLTPWSAGKPLPDSTKKKLGEALKGRKPPKTAFKPGQRPHNYKGGRDRFPNCVVCDKKLSSIHGTHCRKHAFELKRGKNHPNWVNGNYKKSEKKWKNSAYMNWVKEIKKRDSWKCRLQSSQCLGRLEAHHIFDWINYPELRYVINNGITLCRVHHPRGRNEEKRMVPILLELLSVSKD